MNLEFLNNRKNLVILGAVCAVCIAFVTGALRSGQPAGPAETAAETAVPAETSSEEETEEETAAEEERPVHIFSRPSSSLKEIAGEDEEYVPASYRLNLAYFYPENADTSDAIHSYAGEIFQTLNTLNADYLANYYDMSDMTPLSFANRQGQGASRIMGKYNPNDSRHDPKDPSTWKINSFRNVTVNFYDGDGNRINGYYAVQEIMSMASVYAYYHDMDDAEAMEAYCRELFKNAMSSRVSMGSVYYDSGCLHRSKQDEAAEAIAMEAQQLLTEHQLEGSTAISAGLLTGSGSAADGTGTSDTASSDDQPADSGEQDESSASGTAAEDGSGHVPDGAESASGTAEAAGAYEDDLVVSHAETKASESASYAVVGSGSNNVSYGSDEPSYAVYDGSSLGGGSLPEDAIVHNDASDEVVSAGSGDASSADTSAETEADSPDSGAAISAAPAEDPYAGEDIVVSPAGLIRKLRRFLRKPAVYSAYSGILPPVYHIADEDLVVSPASTTISEAPADTGSVSSESDASEVSDAPAAITEQDAASAESAGPDSAQTQDIQAEQTSDSSDTVSGTPVTSEGSDAASDTVSEGRSSAGAESYGYAVVGGDGRELSSGSGTASAASSTASASDGSVSGTAEAEPEELSEEELAIAAQINELLAQANILSGADSYCPGHIDLYITITIKGIDDRNGLFKADKIGSDPANFNDRWQGWTTDKIAAARALNHQDWFETYGLSISSINLTSQLTEEEIQEYLASLPEDISEARRAVVEFALHSVGKVPYYWGGKPNGPGYDVNHFYTLVSADYQGRILRGLDCSGWINWVYWSATGKSLAGESTGSLIGCGKRINRSALRPGDIIIRTGADSHVVMFLGWIGNGNFIGIHETGGVRNNVVVGEMTASWPYYRALLD